MLILGTKPAHHEACFCVVRDGEPLFIYEQERFSRVKHGRSCDLSVLFEALREYAIEPEEIDIVTTCFDPDRLPLQQEQLRVFAAQAGLDPESTAERIVRTTGWRVPVWPALLVAAGFPRHKVVSVRHHLCHCAGVYYASPFDDAAILSVDGSGETETAMLALGVGHRIEVLRTNPAPHSVGIFYQAVTGWLGWGQGEEGKTMALAAYGVPRYRELLRERCADVDEGGGFTFKDVAGWARIHAEGRCPGPGFSRPTGLVRTLLHALLCDLFGPSRRRIDPLSDVHKDVAASAQAICDEVVLRSARWLRAATGSKRLLIAGGVGLNGVSNGLVLREKLFERVVVYPQASDSGTALGGALYAYHRACKPEERRRWVMPHAYWGRAVDVENLETAARGLGARYSRQGDICAAAADLLGQGRIVGWVQGRAEVGPRALGNRSILASPLVPGISAKINEKVKHREPWRPFAPSVLREDLETYFESDQELPYMVVVAALKPQWAASLSAVAHVDGTARVQTVTEESNPRFHALLRAFKERTGVGVLLNTSFNDRGEPLVQTCEQAIELFLRSEMDALVIDDRLFVDKAGAARPAPFSPWRFNLRKLPPGRLLVVRVGEDPRFGPMLDALAQRDPAPRVVFLGGDLGPKSEPAYASEDRSDRFRAGEVEALMATYDCLVCCVPHSADAFVFDERVYSSDAAALSRRVLERFGLPVFWLDVHGDATPMSTALYIHDARATLMADAHTGDSASGRLVRIEAR